MMKAKRGGERGARGLARRPRSLDRAKGHPDILAMPMQRLYRLWCGRKRHSPWLADERQVLEHAISLGLAYETNGSVGLGPLTWIEIGERSRSKARTVPVGRRGT